MPVPLTIGEVARRSGLRASAIRFYEKTGLLPNPDRRGGQRRYDPAILERLAVLEFAKQCGFTLDEARHLFDDFPGDAPLAQRLPEIAAKKIVQLDAHKESVLPHLINVEKSGLSVEELRARLAAAGAPTAAGPVAPSAPAASTGRAS